MSVEDHIHDAIEHLRDAEEVPEQTTKVRVTVLILVMTILGTITAVLAARSDSQAVTTQRQQEIHALATEQYQDAEAADLQTYTESRDLFQLDFERAGAWWIERVTSPSRTVQAMRAEWLQRAQSWNTVSAASGNGYWDRFTAAQKSGELAIVEGQVVASLRNKEDGYIADAAVFAVSLFLVGLVLATHQRSSRRIFVSAAIVLALFASVRVAMIYIQGTPDMTSRTLTAYANGQTSLNEYDYGSATASFKGVIKARKDTPEAWLGLAESLDGRPFPSRSWLAQAIAAYRQVIADGGDSLAVRNNMASDELFLGRLREARRDILLALKTRNDVDWSYAEGSLAEINMASGDLPVAYEDLTTAVDRLDKGDTGATEAFFAVLRHDRAFFQRTGMTKERWQPFYTRAQEIEASFDALGTAAPGPQGHAAVTGLSVKYNKEGEQGIVRLHFTYHDFSKPGIFSLRTYDDSDGNYSLVNVASVPKMTNWPWGNGSGSYTSYVPLIVASGDTYHIEFYWNGNLLASTPVNILSSHRSP
jgi:hypothetical protein